MAGDGASGDQSNNQLNDLNTNGTVQNNVMQANSQNNGHFMAHNRLLGSQKERNNRNNTENIRAAAEVAKNTKVPQAAAAGTAVKVADKVTGGKSSEFLGKQMSKINQSSPVGRRVQKISNGLNESGISSRIARRSSIPLNSVGRGQNNLSSKDDERMQEIKNRHQLQHQKPKIGNNYESDDKGEQNCSSSFDDKEKSDSDYSNQNGNNDSNGTAKIKGFISGFGKIVALSTIPILLVILPIIIVISSVSNIFSTHDDSIGISQIMGEDTGDLQVSPSEDQTLFLERLNLIHQKYVDMGKSFDPVYVTSTMFVLNDYGASLSYNDMTTEVIDEIVRSMLGDYGYDEETFKNNLILSIIPKYLPETTTKTRKTIADEIINQKETFYELLGKDESGTNGSPSTGEFSKWKQYEGEWASVPMGNSGQTVKDIGCFVTSIAILIAKSGVPTNLNPFNPKTFVEYMNKIGGFDSGGSFAQMSNVSKVAPTFRYQGRDDILSYTKEKKFERIKQIVTTPGLYAMVEVKGNTGQHWVAIDTISGNDILMMDPGSRATNLWQQYNWQNTSNIIYFKAG